jgi:hypothetical protein
MPIVMAKLPRFEEPRKRMTEYREAFVVEAMSASDVPKGLGFTGERAKHRLRDWEE